MYGGRNKMNHLSKQEYHKLISILKEYRPYYALTLEEDVRDIVESISLDAKINKKDLSKAKIKLIGTAKGPEIGVIFED